MIEEERERGTEEDAEGLQLKSAFELGNSRTK